MTMKTESGQSGTRPAVRDTRELLRKGEGERDRIARELEEAARCRARIDECLCTYLDRLEDGDDPPPLKRRARALRAEIASSAVSVVGARVLRLPLAPRPPDAPRADSKSRP